MYQIVSLLLLLNILYHGDSQAEDLASSGCGRGGGRNRGSSRGRGSHHQDDTNGLPVRKGNGIQQYV